MKITNGEMMDKITSLNDILHRPDKYPVQFSFALSKNLKTLEALQNDFIEARNKLLDEYNIKDADGAPAYMSTGKIEISKEHLEEWNKSIKELLDIELEVPVHIVEMSILDELHVAPDVLYNCEFMFKN